MALDFHRLGNNEHLFGLDDNKYAYLEEVFVEFKKQTGIFIDPYKDLQLTVDHQKVIIKIIDSYISKTDLNINKEKTKVILGFRGLIEYFFNKKVAIKTLGD